MAETADWRRVVVDQDTRGPATTDLLSVLALLQAPEVETLGITVVSGDQWRDEEVAHALRLLETVGRTDVPVVPGALFPLLNSREETKRREKLYGEVAYKGAWNEGRVPGYDGAWNRDEYYGPRETPPLPEGPPSTEPADEDAAHFLVRVLREHPGEITLFGLGPLTNLALACRIDPELPELARELVLMGGSLQPVLDGRPWSQTPRREFNFWWDPEAARIVLRAPWPSVTLTPVDISVRTRLRRDLIEEIGRAGVPAARYVARWADEEFMWDELAVLTWVAPELVVRTRPLYVDVEVNHGAGYGDTLTWEEGANPGLGERQVEVLVDADLEGFYALFRDLMTRSTSPGTGDESGETG